MKDGFVKIAAGSFEVHPADPAANAGEILSVIENADRIGVRVLVLPELCLTGATCGDLFTLSTLRTGALEALGQVCRGTRKKNLLVFVGLPFQVGAKLYNCAAALFQGQVLGLVPKTNHAPTGDGRWFSAPNPMTCYVSCLGQTVPLGPDLLFQPEILPDLTIGCELGEDLLAPIPPSSLLCTNGATVIVNLASPRALVAGAERWDLLARAQSARLHCGYVLSGAGAGESTTDEVYAGLCRVYENGTLLAGKDTPAPGLAVSDLDLQRLLTDRERQGGFGDPEETQIVPFAMKTAPTVLTRTVDPAPFMPKGTDKARRCQQILDIQAAGLARRLSAIGCKTAVLGLSGGLDSTLALLVTVRAFDQLGLPRSGIQAVTLPCFGTTDRTRSNAWKLAQGLEAPIQEISIGNAVSVHFADIGLPETDRSVTFENAQARERTQVLFDLANRLGGIVVGTGDLSELALGWATYNGDHMSNYDVNADVPKTVIRQVVGWYAAQPENAAVAGVLLDILATPISPELLPPEEGAISQKTEDLVGPYELHDFYLYYALRWGFAPGKVYRLAKLAFAGAYEPKVLLYWLKNFYRRFFAMQFKRSCLTDGPRIGSVALSPRGAWVMPSDASWNLWKTELDKITE